MVSRELIDTYGLDIHKEIIHKKAGGRLEAEPRPRSHLRVAAPTSLS